MSAGVFFSMRLRTLCSALPLVLAACDGSSSLLPGGGGTVTLTTVGSIVAPGATLEVVASNQGLQSYAHGACSVAIEQRVATQWVQVWPAAGAACSAVAFSLVSGGTYRQIVPVPATEGTYRAVMRLSPTSGGDITIVSDPFEVSATQAVELTATADSVDDGAALPLSLRNLTATAWGYNVCSGGRFERRSGSSWVEAPPPLVACTADLQTLGALQTRTASASVPLGYVAGTYRMVLVLFATDRSVVTASDTFVVR